MFRRADVAAVLFVVASMAMLASIASADDFFPPPWDRADPFAVTAEWEFLTPTTLLAPDGPLTNVGVKGSGAAPSGTFAEITGPAVHVPHDGDGAWTSSLAEFYVHFEIDNVIDLEPVKHLRLQVTHGLDTLLAIDTLAGLNGAATGSIPDVPVMTPIDPTHTLITWNMFPNPPWEQFDLVITQGGLELPILDQIVLDTISVPEPSTLALAAFGFVALAALGWRRRQT